jgi:hypothetical protein
MADFWNVKEPCWDFLGCPKNIHSRCSAYHNGDKPCWEQEITECKKVLDFEWKCEDCRVFIYYNFLVPRISRNKQYSIPNYGTDRQSCIAGLGV